MPAWGSLCLMTTLEATTNRRVDHACARTRPRAQGGPPGVPVGRRGLVWWADSEPSVRRLRSGRGFRYVDPAGRPADARTVDRARRLAIPPAWHDVRVCPHPDGYLQATGRDARGRKQYRYHPAWTASREEAKFLHLVEFGEALPTIRESVERDLRLPGMPKVKVLALIVHLLDRTHLRVGSERYARENGSFGLTTLSNRHATVEGSAIRLRFRGKSGRVHELGLRDRRLARLVRRCRELPGRDLFQYIDDDGTVATVRSEDVNDYLRSAAGADVTAKMFRTWAATVLACRALRASGPPACSDGDTRRAVRAATQAVADRLGNTPAVARASYIHPAIPDAYLHGRLEPMAPAATDDDQGSVLAWTDADEAAALTVIRRWAGTRARKPRP